MRRRKKVNSFHQYFPCVFFIVFVRANMNECDVIMSIFQLSTIHFGVSISICPKCGSASNRCSISVSALTALHCLFVCVCFFHSTTNPLALYSELLYTHTLCIKQYKCVFVAFTLEMENNNNKYKHEPNDCYYTFQQKAIMKVKLFIYGMRIYMAHTHSSSKHTD